MAIKMTATEKYFPLTLLIMLSRARFKSLSMNTEVLAAFVLNRISVHLITLEKLLVRQGNVTGICIPVTEK